MCNTLQSSLNTFLLSFVISIFLLTTESKLQKTNALLLLSFCFIQLSDALLHLSIQNNWQNFNLFVSKFIVPLILFSEIPLMYYATYGLTEKRSIAFEYIYGTLCILGFLQYIISCKQVTIQGDNGFLVWCNNPIRNTWGKLLFFFGIIWATYYYPFNIYKIIFYFILTLTFLYTFSTDTFGSGWCHFANSLSIAWLIVYLIEKYAVF
jgi:hypothetical protein